MIAALNADMGEDIELIICDLGILGKQAYHCHAKRFKHVSNITLKSKWPVGKILVVKTRLSFMSFIAVCRRRSLGSEVSFPYFPPANRHISQTPWSRVRGIPTPATAIVKIALFTKRNIHKDLSTPCSFNQSSYAAVLGPKDVVGHYSPQRPICLRPARPCWAPFSSECVVSGPC